MTNPLALDNSANEFTVFGVQLSSPTVKQVIRCGLCRSDRFKLFNLTTGLHMQCIECETFAKISSGDLIDVE
ncbi:MAG: hypothetical protein ACOYM1_12140 [Methylovulum sp.]